MENYNVYYSNDVINEEDNLFVVKCIFKFQQDIQ